MVSSLVNLCLLTVVNSLDLDHIDKKFEIIWNAPSYLCEWEYGVNLQLSKYKIRYNRNQSFFGDTINLFYEPAPGLYPRILENGTFENGGLPQLANFTNHITKEKRDILGAITKADFSGFAVIDWESWVPIFDRNAYSSQQKIYIEQSERLVHKRHPFWNQTEVKTEAMAEFQSSARKLMEITLHIARHMRQKGNWGFYGFPRCYNFRRGQGTCSKETQQLNDQICWLFRASSAVFPSIYLKEQWGTPADRHVKIKGIINEAIRVQKTCGISDCPILAYSRYRYSDSNDFYKVVDLENTIKQSLDSGLDGVVIWDSYHNFLSRHDCLELKAYIEDILGPFLMQL